jgi:hypothetical protein
MIFPNTFKLFQDHFAWAILSDTQYTTLTTTGLIIDSRIYKPNTYCLFMGECFVNMNSGNHIQIIESILQKKYSGLI